VHIHRNTQKRERIWFPGRSGNCVLTGCYTNNPHVLVRYDVKDVSDKYLSLILSQYKKSNNLNYTLSVYCTEDFVLGKQPEGDLPYRCKDVSETWSTYSAGGPIGQDKYIQNPQFALQVPVNATVQIKITTTSTVAANAIVVPVQNLGDGITKATGEPVIDSGKYRHGFVATERKVLKAGSYALIVSNFHVGQTGLFTIQVSSSSSKLKLQKIKS
jgi:hypothetical protein